MGTRATTLEGHEMSDIVSRIPADKLLDWVRNYADDRRYKGKAATVYCRDGTRIEGTFNGYSADRRMLTLNLPLRPFLPEKRGLPTETVPHSRKCSRCSFVYQAKGGHVSSLPVYTRS